MISKGEIIELRNKLKMEKPIFARLVNVDSRTISMWEAGKAKPNSAASAVLIGLIELFRQKSETQQQEVIKIATSAAGMGGLSYLVFTLLDRVTLSECVLSP